MSWIRVLSILMVSLLGSCLAVNRVLAADLIEVYKQALVSDPKFKAARSEWLAARESLAVSKAELLPQINASGSFTRSQVKSELANNPRPRYFNNGVGYLFELRQPIFDFGKVTGVWKARAAVYSAQALFMDAEEKLLQRVAQAYLEVLLAKDILYFAKANTAANKSLFVQAKHKYDVGLIAITDLEDARKNYDIAWSEEIANENQLSDSFERLNEITGVRYTDLDSLKSDLPLVSPEPADIEAWVKSTEKQNFELVAANYKVIEARENVRLHHAGHLPEVSALAGYSNDYENNYSGSKNSTRNQRVVTGLEVKAPIFHAGKISTLAKQAEYIYQQQLAVQEQTRRSVVSQTRQNYLGILSNISKIKADLQAIKSAQSSLRATHASYTVGRRTMSDVLDAQSKLYSTQKTFAEDEYRYIMQLLNLRMLTGTLQVSDLELVNGWLKTSTNNQRPVTKADKLNKGKSEIAKKISKSKKVKTK